MAEEIKKSKIGLKDVNAYGRSFVGTVVSDKMASTVVVAWKRRIHIPKYERYTTRTSKVKAHNPESIDAKEGDIVKIVQCRPLSKTKNFIVVEKMGTTNVDGSETKDSKKKSSGSKKSK